ncbi:hypothetical protein GCM10027446_14610 [Angustibacter peucedani]
MDDHQLRELITYGGGAERLFPTKAREVAVITAADALSSFVNAHVYSSALAQKPDIFLARYADTAEAGEMIAHAPSDARLVWVVRFSNVLTAGSGPAGRRGSATQARAPERHDVLGLIDAGSGEEIAVIDAAADAQGSPPKVQPRFTKSN